MPAPVGNTNALRFGLRTNRYGMVLARLPLDSKGIIHRVGIFRRALEQAVIDKYGEVDVYRASLIQAASGWAIHGALCGAWLNRETNLKLADRVMLSREQATSAEKRSTCLRQLGLDQRKDEEDWLDELFSAPAITPETATAAPGDAEQTPDGRQADQG